MLRRFGAARLVLASACVILWQAGTARAGDGPVDEARRILRLFLDGRHEEFLATGTAELRRRFTVDESRQVRDSLALQYGRFEGEVESTPQTVGKLKSVAFRLRFQKAILKITVGLDADGRMGSFLLTGVESLKPWKRPKYANPEAYTEEKVSVVTGAFTLPGVLALPRSGARVPAVVLVHGSGPHDADESIGPNKPFRDLALGLASRGIAVLRYEKRTHKYGHEMNADSITLDEEVVDDAVSAVGLLRGHPRIDGKRVFVLGHSLGGTAAPFIGRRDREVAGLIIMAGTPRSIVDLVEEQTAYIAGLDGDVTKQEKVQIDEVRQAAAAIRSGRAAELKTPLLGAPAQYWAHLHGLDALGAANGTAVPILILQGGRDYQVTEKCFSAWKKGLAGRKDVMFRHYDGLNHLMMSGKGPPGPRDYEKARHVSRQVIEDISAWILKA
jgi:dienelactone hydrolase